MSNLNINNATTSDNDNTIDKYEVTPMNTDGIGAGEETEYTNSMWSVFWGYFNQHPELKSAFIMKSIWNVGKGYDCDPRTKVILDHVNGWGKETFNEILFNMDLVSRVGRDSFAEIIRADDKAGTLLNLKVLDPSSIRVIVDNKGIIKRYEQISKVGLLKSISNKVLKTKFGVIDFKPNEIFHLSHNRLADQIHGLSDIEGMEETLKAEIESFNDTKKLMHSQAKPFIIFKMKTDDPTTINNFVEKVGTCRNNGDDLFIPDDENLVSYEVVQINPSAFILSWRQDIKNKFYRILGLPQVIFGSSTGGTESQSKVEYLAHEQIFEFEQRKLENQIWNQLGIRINLISPVSLLENLQTDESKDAQNALMFQQNDTTAGSGK